MRNLLSFLCAIFAFVFITLAFVLVTLRFVVLQPDFIASQLVEAKVYENLTQFVPPNEDYSKQVVEILEKPEVQQLLQSILERNLKSVGSYLQQPNQELTVFIPRGSILLLANGLFAEAIKENGIDLDQFPKDLDGEVSITELETKLGADLSQLRQTFSQAKTYYYYLSLAAVITLVVAVLFTLGAFALATNKYLVTIFIGITTGISYLVSNVLLGVVIESYKKNIDNDLVISILSGVYANISNIMIAIGIAALIITVILLIVIRFSQRRAVVEVEKVVNAK